MNFILRHHKSELVKKFLFSIFFYCQVFHINRIQRPVKTVNRNLRDIKSRIHT